MFLKKFTAHLILVFAVCLLLTGQAQAILLEFDPPTNNVTLGASGDVDLVISGLGDGVAPSIGAFDLDVDFDPAIVELTGVVFGTELDLFGLGSIQGVSGGSGSVNIFELSFDSVSDLDALQPGAFILATLTFDTLAAGTSSLVISPELLGDSIGLPLSADTDTGSITVRSVPEPTTLALLSLGLVGLGVARKKKKT